jgi:hydrogenase expression/formation protein HypD
MEICGGQTHTLMRYGIDELLCGSVELVHGPGCPVCVTPLEIIDRAINLARRPDVKTALLEKTLASLAPTQPIAVVTGGHSDRQ